MLDVTLAPGRERSVLRRHPWVMSGAVAKLSGDAQPGAWVRLLSSRGQVLGYGDFAPTSQIRVRLLAFGEAAPAESLVADRVRAAVSRRHGDPLLAGTDAVRLVNAEGDGLPGLVVDRYADTVVLRPSTAAMAARMDALAELLRAETGAVRGVARPDAAVARREGLAATEPALLFGSPQETPLCIREHDRAFEVDVFGGQKTGFYLDQRDSRDLVARLAPGRRVLDVFSYTGGFAVAAARGGAEHVTAVDSSQPALDRAAAHLAANAPDCPARVLKADAFEYLRKQEGTGYDLLVIDPPPLARRRGDVARASRAYKDLLLHALGHARPGARLLFFACSHHVGPDLFAKIVFGASLDAGRPLRWLASLGAAPDHPVAVDHPEGRYLTGALLEVD